MFWSKSNNGLVSPKRREPSQLSVGFPPGYFFLQDVKDGDNIFGAAAIENVSIINSVLHTWKRKRQTDLRSGTLPYVTEIRASSNSSGVAVRASSIASTSSQPYFPNIVSLHDQPNESMVTAALSAPRKDVLL